MDLVNRDNYVLKAHPAAGDQYLTTNGSNWLWAVFAIFAFSWLVFVALHRSARAGEKIFHYLFSIAAFVGLIAYFAMASDLGWSLVTQANNTNHMGLNRQIFYAKYIFWVVAFPTIVIVLGLISGVSWANIAYNVAISWIWVISYLVGAYTRTNYKWGFFVFGTVAYLWLAFNTLVRGRRAARRLQIGRDHTTVGRDHTAAGRDHTTAGRAHITVGRDHTILALWSNILWLLYPVAWGLSDGGNRIGVVGHFIWFGILDLLLIPGTGFVVLILSRRWQYDTLGLNFTQHGRISSGGSGDYHERPVNGRHNGTAVDAPSSGARPAAAAV